MALSIRKTIGFGGKVPNGVRVSGDSVYYALSSIVVCETLDGKQQTYLRGHSDKITALAASSDGRLLATGQETGTGYKADIIVWDLERQEEYRRFKLHKTMVQDLSFSRDGAFLVSVGGEDDGTVVVWDIENNAAVCGSPASTKAAGAVEAVAFSNRSNNTFVTAGSYTLRVWSINYQTRKLEPSDCQLRSLRRVFKCIAMSQDDDEMIYCGTSSGDVVQVSLRTGLLKGTGPTKGFGRGVNSLESMPNGELVVGAGNGTVAVLAPGTFKVVRRAEVEGAVTSLALRGSGHEFFVGTAHSNMYRFLYANLEMSLRLVSHPGGIKDVAFPAGTSGLFATCGGGEIRVWLTGACTEALRISLPGKVCNCVTFPSDGKAILSGWDDGVIRAFYPESGRLKYEINNAHKQGCHALALTKDCSTLVSGGGDGVVRVWHLLAQSQSLHVTTKEHKSKIVCLRMTQSDAQFMSAAQDGSCFIWDLDRCVRVQSISSSRIAEVRYRPDEAQAVSVGTDKLSYWEVYDGALIREVPISSVGMVNTVDISTDGKYCVTGGKDELVKMIDYEQGDVDFTGQGHSEAVTRVKIGPESDVIVSVGDDGAIFIWDYPE